jgi:hypothetical protein
MRDRKTATAILALVVAACGGGGQGSRENSAPPNGDNAPAPPVPSDFVLQYPGPQVFTVSVAGSSDVPVLNYTGFNSIKVSPALPDGLEIDANTGLISGVPTAVARAASYAVTVSNEVGGTATSSVIIQVNEGPFFYSSPAILALGLAMMPLSPRGPSGAASYSVTPQLPSGLTLDPASGVISGTPLSAQPASYYVISHAEALITLKFGLTLSIGSSPSGAIPVSSVSTLGCAYSGGFIGSYTGNAQANDEGLIAIAFTPDGNTQARILQLSDNAVYHGDGSPALNPDGSFLISLLGRPGMPVRVIQGNFSGPDLISGTYQIGEVTKPFVASRLGGSAAAGFRYTGGFGSSGPYRVDFGVLDVAGTQATGFGYQFSGVGNDYRLINRQLGIRGTFNGNTFSWSIADDDISGVDTLSSTGLELVFGDPYDARFFAKTLGCQLN